MANIAWFSERRVASEVAAGAASVQVPLRGFAGTAQGGKAVPPEVIAIVGVALGSMILYIARGINELRRDVARDMANRDGVRRRPLEPVMLAPLRDRLAHSPPSHDSVVRALPAATRA